ncbi:hypothetical protein SEUCBS140593_010507 [Sporothrix eucalyptigena]|uniref:Major facilitator superfamily (MFS) profile domain-containing protein n=1 Tax=Sporothrix eucalyptigena TaxID=1812306 RepID=A0ABP0D4S4_9PEZI
MVEAIHGLGLTTNWVGNGIISYYLAPILSSPGVTSSRSQMAINGGMQVFNWFMALGGALMAEHAGRMRLMLVSLGGMLVCMILVAALSGVYEEQGNTMAGTAVIMASTHLRARYQSLYFVSTSATLCFNQYVNPIAFKSISWKYYFVYVAILICMMIFLTTYAPETRGRTLEEVAALFDDGVAAQLEGIQEMLGDDEKEGEAVVTVEDRTAV